MARNSIMLAALALAALVASAHATCYCKDVLKVSTFVTGCASAAPNPPILQSPTWTFKPLTDVKSGTTPISCVTYTNTANPTPTLANFATTCQTALAGAGCGGFQIKYPASHPVPTLQVCYYRASDLVSSNQVTPGNFVPDKNCYGLYLYTPPVVTDPSSCCSKYAPGSGAYYKCRDCVNTYGLGAKCCSCPATVISDASNCIDCVITANAADKDSCATCPYPDGSNGLIRCWECVKMANGRLVSASQQSCSAPVLSGFTYQRDLCLNYCNKTKFPGLGDVSECEDCVTSGLAAYFFVDQYNPGGACPSQGKRMSAARKL